MAKTYWLKHCHGINPRTGKKVGERHRWSGDIRGDGWGRGHCIWCMRGIDELRYEAPEPAREGSEQHLARALRTAA